MRPEQDSPVVWGRRRLLVVLASVIGFAVLILAGLTFTVVKVFDSSEAASSATAVQTDWPARADGTKGAGYRNAIAAQPMIASDRQDMSPSAPALDQLEPVLVSPATRIGPGDVPTGFDHTPEGAAAQVAAIAVSALEPMSIQHARIVHRSWAADGATFDGWMIAQSIRAFHQAAGTIDGDGSVAVTASPVGIQIKGTDGPDWVLACVQLDVTVAVVQQTRFGFGYCERMQWVVDRWMIAAGKPPAQAPSTWPGSQRSVDAGWHPWVETEVPE